MKIKAVGVQTPTDWLSLEDSSPLPPINTPSIALVNYDIQSTDTSYDGKELLWECYLCLIESPLNWTQLFPTGLIDKDCYCCSINPLQLLNQICSYFDGCFSQSTACITTRFGECSSILLHKLWYIYSYIYRLFSSNTTTIISTTLFLLVVNILMPTTDQPITSSSIVSSSPFLSQTRSFTMTDYTSITDWSFKFADHPHCLPFGVALNNTYSEDFDDAVVAQILTDSTRTIVAADAILTFNAAIINIIMYSSTADCTVVAPIINQMLLFGYFGHPPQKYSIRSPATITKALNISVATTRTAIVIQLNPV